ncbi:Uterine Lumin Expressed/locailized [Caenorhabditis elegans]|uniref:Uterine Lumin Expressed/locailized n=1 Tax=Caenorhabditis elegans TaxID=6239 RepID=Q067X2_CAEEL|nr:Uterine Lumin Expressed/locailized [Caenorhabditis elegans]CAL49433.1 Uterine Lumin Expressed/locailized [Caenorhabditis elegans]|eukprot:NP_001076679.1 Uterine Lumin Expressed/locailized [Caenorhabditis elegans]
MIFYILFLLPLVSGQWGTPPPIVTNEQCQVEYKSIMNCVRNPRLFTRIDEIPRPEKSENLALIEEVTHVLDCSGFLNCNSSRILQSYLFNQRWILDVLHGKLEPCLGNGVLRKIFDSCDPAPSYKNFKKFDDDDCNRITVYLPCFVNELKNQPTCKISDVNLFKRMIFAMRSGCVMGHQMKIEFDNYGIIENSF